MAKLLCLKCVKCNGLTPAGSDCSAAGTVVTPVARHQVEDGRYENCMWRKPRASSSIELKLVNLIVRLFENYDAETGPRDCRKQLNRREVAEIEAQVRKDKQPLEEVALLELAA